MLLGDYHTHTIHSDATGTVFENVKSAFDKKLKELAITDHGLGKSIYQTQDFEGLIQAKKEVIEARKAFPSIKIYLGIESNIISLDGTIDLSKNEINELDLIVCGYHRFSTPKTYVDAFVYYPYNNFFSKLIKPSRLVLKRNTDAAVAAIRKYPIDIFAHINNFALVDAYEVGSVCAEMGTYVEVNERHIAEIMPILDKLLKTECRFLLNTDSHKSANVGNTEKGIKLITDGLLPANRVDNYNKTPIFTRANKRGKMLY